ncbi:MAG: pyridoxine 5'-phosphate oxidase C-terminal domain-containing protein, partial [Sphingomonadaceae bacterium]
QQKVQFAGAVIHAPELVILDEPFTGLDPIATRQLKEEIAAMAAKGVTVVFSTHVLPQAEELCDVLCLVNRGRAILHGSLTEVRARFEGAPIPRPPFWSGWRVQPRRYEFWEERAFRQHERCTFTATPEGGWRLEWLFP